MADSTPEPDAPEIRPAKSTRRQIVRGCLAGLGVVLGVELFYALLGTNFRTVVPGRAYRSTGSPAKRWNRPSRITASAR